MKEDGKDIIWTHDFLLISCESTTEPSSSCFVKLSQSLASMTVPEFWSSWGHRGQPHWPRMRLFDILRSCWLNLKSTSALASTFFQARQFIFEGEGPFSSFSFFLFLLPLEPFSSLPCLTFVSIFHFHSLAISSLWVFLSYVCLFISEGGMSLSHSLSFSFSFYFAIYL